MDFAFEKYLRDLVGDPRAQMVPAMQDFVVAEGLKDFERRAKRKLKEPNKDYNVQLPEFWDNAFMGVREGKLKLDGYGFFRRAHTKKPT